MCLGKSARSRTFTRMRRPLRWRRSVRKANAIRNAPASDSSEACEPGAKNALPSWPTKYEMPGERSKPALHTFSRRFAALARIGKSAVVVMRGRRSHGLTIQIGDVLTTLLHPGLMSVQSHTQSASSERGTVRFRFLDGLRGWAAVVVLLHHL